ncbi:PepSY domain-containing protein [Roseicyclus persicicus]|uniref:PepSY domain-containing protein n=1 Tax=Roseicyclus persicicus TaxID=2650661 RepID=A0A7X6GXA2_9RHOB|nr:PepSY domain-containing protein [Roseibacterium persicicum]NKX44056.1 PepSY domain-containing protein [Roseibacterium persicicum]
MRPTLAILTALLILPAGMALADDDDCRVPMADWQPREAVLALAGTNGWQVDDLEVDDGCYEIEGRDADGRRIEVTLHPATLALIELEYEDGEDRPRSDKGERADD